MPQPTGFFWNANSAALNELADNMEHLDNLEPIGSGVRVFLRDRRDGECPRYLAFKASEKPGSTAYDMCKQHVKRKVAEWAGDGPTSFYFDADV